MYLCAADARRHRRSRSSSRTPAGSAASSSSRPPASACTTGASASASTPATPRRTARGRRPPHTLSPALVTRPDGSLRAVIGTMGGDSQPQILVQLLAGSLRHGESPGGRSRAPGGPSSGTHRVRHVDGTRGRRGAGRGTTRPPGGTGPRASGATPCAAAGPRGATASATPRSSSHRRLARGHRRPTVARRRAPATDAPRPRCGAAAGS